ncbi:hypothetical protein [Shewanella sp. MEBiC00475]|uniref:hypothetical protein n=1 Tax=Shewanella sp. MEBiC00475 TaxID=2575361 RepID=UPI0010C13482|nr:hypothetical protein [Shewanella sp. MEBiC00475]
MSSLTFEILEEKQIAELKSLFDYDFYTSNYKDVVEAGLDPFEHYLTYGWKEGRDCKQEPLESLGSNTPLNEHCLLIHEAIELLLPTFSERFGTDLGDYKFKRDLYNVHIDYHFYISQLEYSLPRELVADHYLLIGSNAGIKPNRYFSVEDYCSIYEDILQSGVEPFYHFCAVGMNEGRLPNRFSTLENYQTLPESFVKILISNIFDEESYLNENNDVKALGIEGLHHYISNGWKEGRAPNVEYLNKYSFEIINKFIEKNINPALINYVSTKYGLSINNEADIELFQLALAQDQQSSADVQYEIDILSSYVDQDFYFTLYPDVSDSKYTAVEHYCKFGWRELKDPSADFSTKFYLDDNPDVVDANVNPLFHYVAAGQFERRYQRRPGGLKSDVIYGLETLAETCKHWQVNKSPQTISDKKLAAIIKSLGKKVVISISHDVYIKHTGGVQGCIGIEEKSYLEDGVDYLHFAPFQPLPILSEYNGRTKDEFYLHISLNGEYVGVADAQKIKKGIKNSNSTFRIVLHALHGHSPEFIIELAKAIKVEKSILWIHDFFTICEGYNLLRNKIEYCGAPEVNSKACGVCVYGQQRQKHISRIDQLLTMSEFVAIAPSNSAAFEWKKSISGRPFENLVDIQVINHIELVNDLNLDAQRNTKKLNIGFVGYPSFHKGWADFVEFKRQNVASSNYNFFHIGSEQTDELCLNFVHCAVTKETPDAMVDAIKGAKLDYVYIPAPWPETFNIVCYEAIAAGAKIITHPGSGNVADFVESSGHGLVIESLNELIKTDLNVLTDTTTKTVYDMKYSKMSASLEGIK